MRTRRLSVILATALSLAIIFPGAWLRGGRSSIVTAARNDDMTAVRAQITKRANVNEVARRFDGAALVSLQRQPGDDARAACGGRSVNSLNHYGITPCCKRAAPVMPR
jgi:hypothetical protein